MTIPIFLSLIQAMCFAQPTTLDAPADGAFAVNATGTKLQAQHFRATVNGTAFTPDEFWANAGGGVISIQAEDINEAGFQLMLPDHIVEGSHELSYDTAYVIQCLYSTGEDSGEAMGGSLRIMHHDPKTGRIEGTFSFQGELSDGQTFDVSEGSFALTYGPS